jgi:hypothetical protein
LFRYRVDSDGGLFGFPSGQHALQYFPTMNGFDFPIRSHLFPVGFLGGPPQVWFVRSYKATLRSSTRCRNHSLLLMFSSSQMRRRASICASVKVTEMTLTGSPMLAGMITRLHSIILSRPPVFVPKTRFHDSNSAAHATAEGDWDKGFGRRR